jgi:hypothetical protein
VKPPPSRRLGGCDVLSTRMCRGRGKEQEKDTLGALLGDVLLAATRCGSGGANLRRLAKT